MLDALKSNKFVFIIGGVLLAIIIAALLAFLALQSDNGSKQPLPPTAKTQQTTQVPAVVSEPVLSEETTDDFAALVDESLLTQPIEEDPALIKDEIVQLTDIQSQLSEQKDLLEQQNKDSDKLIELKEQQLLALQKQLEMLDAQ